jgi:hypothetical protein
VVAFYDEHEVKLQRLLTDRGTEFCGSPERHEYQLYLAVEDIDQTRTKTKILQTNEICERFHHTVLDEFYRVALITLPGTRPPTRETPGQTGARLQQLPHGTTNTGRLCGNGDDQEGTGSGYR